MLCVKCNVDKPDHEMSWSTKRGCMQSPCKACKNESNKKRDRYILREKGRWNEGDRPIRKQFVLRPSYSAIPKS